MILILTSQLLVDGVQLEHFTLAKIVTGFLLLPTGPIRNRYFIVFNVNVSIKESKKVK